MVVENRQQSYWHCQRTSADIAVKGKVEWWLHPQWTATLNINNVFDKTYATVGSSAYYNFYGKARNVGPTVRGHF
jgi:outer membrane receptor for ferric coprogen and ferric-rhodotorulic acid